MLSDRLKNVILKVLKLKNFELRDDMRAYQVPGWDSLSHVIVLSAIEKEFGIRFKTSEVLGLNNIGDLQALIDKTATNAS